MQILEPVKMIKNDTQVLLILSYKEARILFDAMEEYSKNNKRKLNAKKLHRQMYEDLPIG